MNTINQIPNIKTYSSNNFFLLAGPCVIENEEMVFNIAKRIQAITTKLEIPYIFKASYRKANRSRIDSFSGIGDQKALEILARVRSELQIPVVTDIHSAAEATMAAPYVDVLQIPAFLCRQTDFSRSCPNRQGGEHKKRSVFNSRSYEICCAKSN